MNATQEIKKLTRKYTLIMTSLRCGVFTYTAIDSHRSPKKLVDFMNNRHDWKWKSNQSLFGGYWVNERGTTIEMQITFKNRLQAKPK